MKDKFKTLLFILNSFGLLYGIVFLLQLLINNTNKLYHPKIKYPFKIRKNTTDFATFFQVFIKNEYNIKYPIIPKIIIDGGANIGMFAIKIKNEYKLAKILCIEPDPDNFNILKLNVSKYNNIICYQAGLWNKVEKLIVYDKYNLGKWGMVVKEDSIYGNVSGISIKYLCDQFEIEYIDILKLDIETSEKVLFQANYENWLPKCKIIIIELHDRLEPGCSKTFFEALNKSMKNYSFEIVGENIIITNLDLV